MEMSILMETPGCTLSPPSSSASTGEPFQALNLSCLHLNGERVTVTVPPLTPERDLESTIRWTSEKRKRVTKKKDNSRWKCERDHVINSHTRGDHKNEMLVKTVLEVLDLKQQNLGSLGIIRSTAWSVIWLVITSHSFKSCDSCRRKHTTYFCSTFLCECVYEIKQLLMAVFCLCPFPDLHPDAPEESRLTDHLIGPLQTVNHHHFKLRSQTLRESVYSHSSAHMVAGWLWFKDAASCGGLCVEYELAARSIPAAKGPRGRDRANTRTKWWCCSWATGWRGDDTALSLTSKRIQRKQEFSKRAKIGTTSHSKYSLMCFKDFLSN